MRTEIDLERWLGTLARGRAACVFTDDVEDALSVLQRSTGSESPSAKVVSLTWRDVPPLANELNLLVSAMAKAIPGFFPALYASEQSERQEQWSAAQVESEAHTITRSVLGVDGGACRRILAACYKGEIPSLGKLNRSEQARQFALAIDPFHLFVFIAVVNVPANGEGLHSLAQGAEWLASNIRGRVILVLPCELGGRHELDHVSYGACRFTGESELASVEPIQDRVATNEPRVVSPSSADTDAEPVVSISPVQGKPAKNSEAEQSLYAALIADRELKSLFSYNQPVQTVTGQVPIVDVLWASGRLAIEVDGQEHRRPKAFGLDRRRDYELWLTGYAVIRFMDNEVLYYTHSVVERIRAAVRHLRQREKS